MIEYGLKGVQPPGAASPSRYEGAAPRVTEVSVLWQAPAVSLLDSRVRTETPISRIIIRMPRERNRPVGKLFPLV